MSENDHFSSALSFDNGTKAQVNFFYTFFWYKQNHSLISAISCAGIPWKVDHGGAHRT
jgi:hypothetical protein